jgi:hypothetical protein
MKMKKIILVLVFVPFFGLAQLKDLIKKGKQQIGSIKTNSVGGIDISAGLKEALNNGITKQVSLLTAVDGFYGNEAVKILMPPELLKVDGMMRKIGLGNLADDGIKSLNRAAEDAVKTATPIFVEAIKNMSFADAKSILLGSQNAATSFLQTGTTKSLYSKFSPVVQNSIGKVGADVVWSSIINKYNAIPLMGKVNPDLTDYVTQKALEGVFKMIAVEEKNIRTKLDSRTTKLLQQVFALQDR